MRDPKNRKTNGLSASILFILVNVLHNEKKCYDLGEFVILMQFSRDEIDQKKTKMYASTVKKHTFDICWHFAISMNYKLKISARRVFPLNLRNVFQLLKKKAVNFIYLFVNMCRKFAGKFRSIFWLICSEKLKKDLLLASQPPPFNLKRQHLLLDIFTFEFVKKMLNCRVSATFSSYRACNSRLSPAFTVNIAAVFSRNQAGVKNRNRFKQKRRNITQSQFILWMRITTAKLQIP